MSITSGYINQGFSKLKPKARYNPVSRPKTTKAAAPQMNRYFKPTSQPTIHEQRSLELREALSSIATDHHGHNKKQSSISFRPRSEFTAQSLGNKLSLKKCIEGLRE